MKRALGVVLGLVTLLVVSTQVGSPGAASKARPRPRPAASGAVIGQSSTLLPDGTVLLLGGEGLQGALSTAVIENPQTGNITTLPTGLLHPRYGHTATLLPDGTVFIFGGVTTGGTTENVAELFNPVTQQFQNLPPTGLTPRSYHTATLLTDGRVIVAGGISSSGATLGIIEAWSFQTNTETELPPGLITPRSGHTATLLADETVLLWGGVGSTGTTLNDGEIFDPVTDRTTTTTVQPQANNQPPQIEASLPPDQATNIPVDIFIALRFSKPLNVATVNSQTVTLTGPSGSVDVNVVPAEGGMLAFIGPKSVLTQGDTFTLTVDGATDTAGNALPATSITFTTVGVADSSGSSALPTAGTSDGDMWVPGTDNFQGSWKSGQGTSPWQKLAALQAAAGVTALSGQALRLNGLPLEGVTLQIGNEKATTDQTGRFLLPNLTAGHQVLLIDGTTANQQGRTYGVFQAGVDIVAGTTTTLSYTIWMTRLDMAHAVTIPSPTTAAMIVSTPLLPGLELHLPAGTVIRDRNGNAVKQISITPIPIDQPPFPLPAGVTVPIYFTIQPGDAYIDTSAGSWTKGAQLYYPNSHNAAPGTTMDFWNYDPLQKGWYVYGMGTVSADGKQVVPDPGVEIYEFTGAMVATPSSAPTSGPPASGGTKAGDPVDLSTGLFVPSKTDLYLPDVIPINVTRTYRPNDATSRAFGVGTSLNYDIFLVGDTSAYSYFNIILPDGGRIACPRTSSGTGWTDAVMQCSSTPGPFFGAQIVWNPNASSNGGWTLTTKDGTAYIFPEDANSTRGRLGAITSITDRNENTLIVTRDANGNATRITSPNGRWIQLSYDGNFRVTALQDNLGRTVSYTYDSAGRLTNVVDVNNEGWQYGYTGNNMTTLTDPRHIVYLQNQYDSSNRVTKQILADNVSNYQFSYNPGCTSNCSVIYETDVTDPNGNVEKVTFNTPPTFSNGFQTGGTGSAVTFAYGTASAQTYSYTYQSGTNLLTSVTDPLSRVTSYGYDSEGNTTSITRLYGTANAVTTSFTYDPAFNQLTSVTDPLQHTTSIGLDPDGNIASVTDPLQQSTTNLVVNSEGQVKSVTDPLMHTTSFNYNGGDLTTITDPLSRTTTLFTDAGGRLIARTDAQGERTKYSYNALNEVTQITDPAGQTTSFIYDENGNLKQVTDANNHDTKYTYDSMDRLSTREDALNRPQESYQYDGNGNLTQYTDRRGKVSAYSYDALNRRTSAGFGKSGSTYESTINYTFDAGNRLTQAVDSVTGTITRGYDGLDRMTSEATPQGTVSYGYDGAGRRTSMTAGSQAAVNYSYDNDNRLLQITQGSSTVAFSYDIDSRRTSLTLPNGIVMSYGYDNGSQLTGITYTLSSTTIGNLTYSYDLAGRRISAGGTYAGTSLPAAISTTEYDAANELTQWGTATPTYDSNGNILSDGTNSYVWNARNQLASMNSGGMAFQYDPFGRRVAKTNISYTTNYLYDGVNPVQELAGTTPTANLLTGGLDEYFQRTDSTGTSNFLTDALGSTLSLTDGSGNPLAQYAYEPFGNTTITGSSTNPYQYTGRENDGTGVYFYRGRYYNPTFQRFISEDPIGIAGGINEYAYVGNNPVNFTDPFGADKRGAGWGTALAHYLWNNATNGCRPICMGTVLPSPAGLAEAFAAEAAETTGTALSTIRLTQEGESFLRYESGNPAFSRVTSEGGLQPGTFTAPASEGLQPVESLNDLYNLPNGEIPRGTYFEINPPAGTQVIGPRPVVGGLGNEVIFIDGAPPGSVGPGMPTPGGG